MSGKGALCDGVVAQRLSVLGQLPGAGPGHKIHVHGTSGLFELVPPTLSGRVWRWWSGGSATQTVVAVNDTLQALEATGGPLLTPDVMQHLSRAGEGLAHLAATYETTHEPFVRDALHAASCRCFALLHDDGAQALEKPVVEAEFEAASSPEDWRREAAALERRAADLELEAFLLGESAWPSPPSFTPTPTPTPSPSMPAQEQVHVQEAPLQIVMQVPLHPMRPVVGGFALPSSPVRIVSFATYPRRA
jgi:hypothetical protein